MGAVVAFLCSQCALFYSVQRIMVLDGGEIREIAPPQELQADKESIFYSLADQAGAVSS